MNYEEGINWNDRKTKWLIINALKEMELGNTWTPQKTSYILMNTGDKNLSLIRCIKHPEIIESLKRIHALLIDSGFTYTENDVIWDDVPFNEQEMSELAQEYVETEIDCWKCTCGIRLKEMNFDDVFPEYHKYDKNSSQSQNEIWVYNVECPCGLVNRISSGNFYLMHGDFRVNQCKIGSLRIQGLTRQEICDYIYDYDNDLIIVGPTLKGVKIPPWMWGVVCIPIINQQDGGE